MLEVVRINHKLKVNEIGNDDKEWRSHMDKANKKYHESVKGNLPDVRY